MRYRFVHTSWPLNRHRAIAFYKLLCLCLWTSTLHAQTYPQNYFRYPLDSLPDFVSPFGGLRDNHFHSGADLRTGQREGLPVYAVADGYIVRIKIQSIGYGKAIYINHPNGYTSVYGHLQRYHGAIANWIQGYQYKEQSFEFDKVFEKPVLYVKKGDTIGFSGNSGGSTGPHLHYEIRDTRSEKIINPLYFGINLHDTLKPVINNMLIYKFVAEGLLLKRRITISTKNTLNCDSMLIYKDTLVLDQDVYGLGIETYDYIHNAKDEKGIYQYALWLNGTLKFSHEMSKFAFDESKYINVHIDYPYYKLEKVRVQKCFIDDGNEFVTYKTDASKGRMFLPDKTTGNFDIIVNDYAGNYYWLRIPYRIEGKRPDEERNKYYKLIKSKPAFYPAKTNNIVNKDFMMLMTPGTLYDTVYYDYVASAPLKHSLSKVFCLHQALTPLHKSMDLAVRPFDTSCYKDKLLLAYFDRNENNFRSAGGAFENGFVRAKVSAFGSYFVTIDTLAPAIKQLFLSTEANPGDSLTWSFDIRDNFSGIAKYEAYLDCHWIMLDYDAKNSLVTYRFDQVYRLMLADADKRRALSLPALNPELLIRVTDRKGNVGTHIFWPMSASK